MELSQAKHAFVTGGASGIGLGIADALAARGIPVTIADIDAETLAKIVGTRGNSFRGVHLDTRDRDGWARAKAEAEAVFGPVDILVNNAGIAPNGQGFADMDPESFDRTIAINLTGIYNGVSAFARDMRDRGRGHIVNTSSLAGLATVVTGVGAYSAAKFGVTAITEALRTELTPHGIGVTLLVPGMVHTNLAANTQKIGGDVRKYNSVEIQSDVTPAHVGAMVTEAIEQNAPYVMTQGDAWPMVQPRFDAIKAAFEFRANA